MADKQHNPSLDDDLEHSPQTEMLQEFLDTPPAERAKKFMTVTQAADYVGKNHRTVNKWIDEGKIEAVKVGGTFYIRTTDLTNFLKRKANTA